MSILVFRVAFKLNCGRCAIVSKAKNLVLFNTILDVYNGIKVSFDNFSYYLLFKSAFAFPQICKGNLTIQSFSKKVLKFGFGSNATKSEVSIECNLFAFNKFNNALSHSVEVSAAVDKSILRFSTLVLLCFTELDCIEMEPRLNP